MRKLIFFVLAIALSAPVIALAQSERSVRYEIEGGILGTRNMEFWDMSREIQRKIGRVSSQLRALNIGR
jgi:hypothetical protein